MQELLLIHFPRANDHFPRNTLKETWPGDVKTTTFHSVHQLSQRLGQNALTDRCDLVQLLHGYREGRHSHHGTLFGPAPFGSSLVYQQRGSANIHIPQKWMFGDMLPKSPASVPTSWTSLADRSTEVLELYKRQFQVSQEGHAEVCSVLIAAGACVHVPTKLGGLC